MELGVYNWSLTVPEGLSRRSVGLLCLVPKTPGACTKEDHSTACSALEDVEAARKGAPAKGTTGRDRKVVKNGKI